MPKSLDELSARGAIDAPLESTQFNKTGRRGPRSPQQTRVWEATVQLNGKPIKIIQSYSVPLNLESLRKAMRNKIERDKRLNEIRGDGQDGIYYATVYAPRREGPVPKEEVKGPLKPSFETAEQGKYIGDYIVCPGCRGQLRRVMREEARQEVRVLTLECNHEVQRE